MKTTTPEPEKPPAASSARASILYWKRLAPEDAKDAIGTSTTPHFSTDEPKNPSSYALFHASSGSSIGIGSGSSGVDPQDGSAIGNSTSSNEGAAKMTIGPFLEDEDAVVAYWRFEEGSTASDDDTKRTLESSDTTKRENHLQILQFGPVMSLVTATAPVDKGEEGKLQEAFSLRFPARDVAPSDEWGAMCAVRPGSTLDIGLVFDEDPYRRKFSLEAWVRNFVLARKQQQAQEEGDDFSSGDDGGIGASALSDDTTLRRLVSRRGVDKSIWWEFGLCDGGFLYLTFGEHTLKAEEKVSNAAAWQHVAFSVDITSPKHALLKLFLQARCVASKEIHNVDANAKLLAQATKALAGMAPGELGLPPPPSTVHLGLELTDYEMTEVRAWANARTVEQLNDMKENYLGIAETKRRMKIAIHQRNCQCEKCLGRRTKPLAGGKAALLAAPLFPSTPPSSGSARDRRRPQPKA